MTTTDPHTNRARAAGTAGPTDRERNLMTTEKPTKAEVWKIVYRELIGNAIIPVCVRMHPSDISVAIQLQDNQFEDVAAALAAFGMAPGVTYEDDGKPWLWFEGEPREFYAWGNWPGSASPLLPGWRVELYCQIRTADFPLLPAATAVKES